MATSVVLALDTRYAKTDGTYPVVLRISHFGKLRAINTGIHLLEKDWDDKRRIIKSSYKGTESTERLNNYLLKKKTSAFDLITKLDEQKKLATLSVNELKQLIEQRPQSQSFFTYMEKLIKDFRDSNRIGNARAYECTLAMLRKFRNQKDLPFQEVSVSFLKSLEISYLGRGNTLNGLAVNMRTIRATYNYAIKDGTAQKELYPFANYTIQTTKTKKRAIKINLLQRIKEKVLESDHPLFHTRNFFISSFFLRGMSFADFAELKVSNIVDGRIKYERKKTGTQYDIKITKGFQEILDLYLPGKKKTDYIFPIIKREKSEDQYKDILWARSRFNKKLKKLAQLCKIEENMTSYVARHTFATHARNIGVDITAISGMLGHSSTKVTEIYLDSLASDTLDDLHDKIVE